MASVPTPHQFAVGEIATADNINTYFTGISFLENPPIAQLYQTSGQSVPSGSNTAVTFDSTLVDTYGGHSNSVNNTRYTAQVAGWYLCCGLVAFPQNNNGGRSANLQKTGVAIQSSLVQQPPSTVFNCIMTTPSVLTFMNVGDYIEVIAEHNAGVGLTLVTGAPAGSGLSVVWVHA